MLLMSFFCIKELRYFNQLSSSLIRFCIKKTQVFKQVEQFSLMNTNENDWCHSLSFDDLFSPFWFKIQTYYSRTQSSIIPVHVCKSIWLIIFYVCVYENLFYLIKKKSLNVNIYLLLIYWLYNKTQSSIFFDIFQIYWICSGTI